MAAAWARDGRTVPGRPDPNGSVSSPPGRGGGGLLAGALFRTPEQVHSIGPALGITLGMLGGCMWPLAIVPAWLRTAGHVVPQSWAVASWTELLSRHGGLHDILGYLAILAAYAAGLLLLATLALRRRLTSAT